MQHALLHPLLILFARFPKLGGFVGLIVTIVFGYGGFVSWSSLQKMPEHPILISIEETSDLISRGGSFWVTIHQVNWDCANIIGIESNDFIQTKAFFTDKTGAIVGVALFPGRPKALSCDELPKSNLTGVLSTMNAASYKRLSTNGFNLANYQTSTTRLFLCTFCGRGNSNLGVIICTIMSLVGLSMYPASLSLRTHYMKKGML